MDRISKYNLAEVAQREFKEQFNAEGNAVVIAPGRINFIGEHTDYNLGFAMPIGINRWICTVAKKRTDKKINIYSYNFNETISTTLSDLESLDLWEKYTLGCIQVIKDEFNIQNGADILIKGNIPIGFGFSSSAALEVSLIGALLHIYDFKIDFSLILKLSNRVENNYLQIQSGVLDQYASIFSKKSQPLIIDFYNLNHSYCNMNIEGVSWVIINSMVKRELVESKYNERVDECKLGLKKLNQTLSKSISMNEITVELLENIKSDKTLYNRLYHVASENQRVLLMKGCFEKGDLIGAGNLLNNSHESLSKYYEVSCNEIEAIIKLSNKQEGFYGGRIMGGGFGGCTINLVDSSKRDLFIKNVMSDFLSLYNYKIKIETIDFSDGFEVLH